MSEPDLDSSPNRAVTTGPSRPTSTSNSVTTDRVEVLTHHQELEEQSQFVNRPATENVVARTTANLIKDFDAPQNFASLFRKSFPNIGVPAVSFRPLQQWEGIVLEVRAESFVARLLDDKDESLVEEAEIDLEEISPEDQDLVVEGAVFYWKIEYQDRPKGRQRASGFRFRRLPAWTPEQIASARQRAARNRELIGWK